MTGASSSGSLFGHVLRDAAMAERLSDEALVRGMIQVEVHLAAAQAVVGVVPREAAEEIARKANGWMPAVDALRDATERNGTPVAGLAHALRVQVGGSAADWVHWGATSQDISDTAGMLQLRDALALLESRMKEVAAHLARHAIDHRSTLMTGRTLGQAALPTTFGLKAAWWLATLLGHLDRLDQLRPRLLVVQLGGAVGTLAALGPDGLEVEAELARRLDLGVPSCPWHTRREALAECAGWLALVTGGLGKMGEDVTLLAQSGIDELRESADAGRGASSTMPQKRNPVRAPRLVAAARHNARLLGSMYDALVQENERGTHGGLLEQLALPAMLQTTAGALQNALALVQGLVVRTERMATTVEATRGALLAEAATLHLARHVGREEATGRVRAALAEAQDTGEHLVDVLARRETVPVQWTALRDEAAYLGSADRYVERVLQQAADRGIEAFTGNG